MTKETIQITCKNCDSEHVIKKGTYKGAQLYFCKACNRKFKADAAREQAKTFILETPDLGVAFDLDVEKNIEELWGGPQPSVAETEGEIAGPEDIPWQPEAEEDVETSPNRNPATVLTINQLHVALFQDFSLQDNEQLAELNINNWGDLRLTPAEAYAQVAAVR